jgi:hypothetical protein
METIVENRGRLIALSAIEVPVKLSGFLMDLPFDSRVPRDCEAAERDDRFHSFYVPRSDPDKIDVNVPVP